jgi:hypothetical protein
MLKELNLVYEGKWRSLKCPYKHCRGFAKGNLEQDNRIVEERC